MKRWFKQKLEGIEEEKVFLGIVNFLIITY